MSGFQHVEGEYAILVTNGVYKQAQVFNRGGYLYAQASGGFVRLHKDGHTSKPKTRLDYLTWTGEISHDAMGRLCDHTVPGAKRVPLSSATRHIVAIK